MDSHKLELASVLQNKKVLFVTTKNLDYIRNKQELRILQKYAAAFDVIGSGSVSYIRRILYVWVRLLTTGCRKYDFVFLGFSPQLVYPLFFWKFRHVDVFIDFFISVYDTLVCDRKLFVPDGVVSCICKWIDRYTLRKAKLIISDTNAHGDYFAREFGVERKKIRTLYLEADPKTYYPMVAKKKGKLLGKYVVLYFGSALPLQGIDVVLKAAKKVCAHPEIYVIIIGPVERMCERPLCDNMEYHQWLPQQELAYKIAQADLCLAGHFNAGIDKAKRTVPGKAYIYRAMNKPMILGDNEATREIYDESMEEIYFVRMGDPDALAEKIIELHEKWQEWTE